jgi:hypothetical protein
MVEFVDIGCGSWKELCASSSAILIVARRWGVLPVSVAAVAAGWIDREFFCLTEAPFLCRPEALGGAAHSHGQSPEGGPPPQGGLQGT